MYVHIFVCVCRWRLVRWQPVCVWVWLRKRYQIYSGQNHQRVAKRHLEAKFGDRTNMYVLYVSQDTPMLEPVIEPLEEECVILLCIHHLSLLRPHRPSCRTLLSYCILPLYTMGSSPVDTPAPHFHRGLAAASDCFWPEWQFTTMNEKPGESSTLESRFLFGGGCLSHKNTNV